MHAFICIYYMHDMHASIMLIQSHLLYNDVDQSCTRTDTYNSYSQMKLADKSNNEVESTTNKKHILDLSRKTVQYTNIGRLLYK